MVQPYFFSAVSSEQWAAALAKASPTFGHTDRQTEAVSLLLLLLLLLYAMLWTTGPESKKWLEFLTTSLPKQVMTTTNSQNIKKVNHWQKLNYSVPYNYDWRRASVNRDWVLFGMFKFESYITPILLSHVQKYVKNIEPPQSQVFIIL